MAALTWIEATDEIIGAGHPQKSDTKNRAGIMLNTNILVGHDTAGRHRAQDTAIVGEINTYTGDGASEKVISLTNTALNPKLIIVWEGSGQVPVEKMASMTGDISFCRYGVGSMRSWISQDIGEFTVKYTTILNVNLTTYYYLVLGIDTTSTYTGTPAAGSDPTWITSSTSNLMIGDGTASVSAGNIANNVESAINTLFGIAHNTTTGAHTTDPYSDFGKVETGEYIGNGVDDRNISLENIDIEIVGLLIQSNTGLATQTHLVWSGDNTNTEPASAFYANAIQSTGIGTFQLGTSTNVNGDGITYYYIATGD